MPGAHCGFQRSKNSNLDIFDAGSDFWQDDPIEQIRGHTMRVAFPRDLDVKRLIDKMADYVSREGPDFERMIIQR